MRNETEETLRLAKEAGFAIRWTGEDSQKGQFTAEGFETEFRRLIALARASAAPQEPVAEVAAYKWAYEYLQSRMESIGRDGWAHDCDGEIEDRIRAAPIAQTADARELRQLLVEARPHVATAFISVNWIAGCHDAAQEIAELRDRIDVAISAIQQEEK